MITTRRAAVRCSATGSTCPGRSLVVGSAVFALLFLAASAWAVAAYGQDAPILAERVEGLLIGTLVGDALSSGDPVERSAWTRTETPLTDEGRAELARSIRLKPGSRPAAPDGPWISQGPAGTLGPAARWQVLLFRSLEAAAGPDRRALADASLAWSADSTGRFGTLPTRWLHPVVAAARAASAGETLDPVMGGDPLPLTAVAALAARRPDVAYRMARELDFAARQGSADFTAALVAGIAAAMQDGSTLDAVERAIRETGGPDASDRLDFARNAVSTAGDSPARLFRLFEAELDSSPDDSWLELVMSLACARIAGEEPLAGLRLAHEFGPRGSRALPWVGALLGALHGSRIFVPVDRAAVSRALREEYGAGLGPWMVAVDRYRVR